MLESHETVIQMIAAHPPNLRVLTIQSRKFLSSSLANQLVSALRSKKCALEHIGVHELVSSDEAVAVIHAVRSNSCIKSLSLRGCPIESVPDELLSATHLQVQKRR